MTKAPTPAVAAPDIQSIRATLAARCAMPKDALGAADSAGVTERDLSVPMRDGSHIRARVYSSEAANAGGRKESKRLLVVMLHSGVSTSGRWSSRRRIVDCLRRSTAVWWLVLSIGKRRRTRFQCRWRMRGMRFSGYVEFFFFFLRAICKIEALPRVRGQP